MRKKRLIVFCFAASLACSFIVFTCLSLSAQTPDAGESYRDRIDRSIIQKLKAESGKNDVQIYQELGLVYFQQEDFDRSFMYFNMAVALNPRAWWAWYYMGLLNMEEPESYFKKAIQANPRFAPSYYWLGRYYCKKKNIRESRRFFEDYVKIAKNDPEETPRIRIAERFIELMKSGETDYEQILEQIDF